MSLYTSKIVDNSYYHIYNRGNNFENIFYNRENYVYFLKKYDEYMSDYVQTYVFCLLPNHFHFLIKTLVDSVVISEQFRIFFKTYAEKINKQTGRSGSLFLKPFRRKIITEENYLKRMIFYIHYNPVHHKISESFGDYEWSSYKRILDPQKSGLQKEEVLNLFNGREGYIEFHNDLSNLSKIREFVIEK